MEYRRDHDDCNAAAVAVGSCSRDHDGFAAGGGNSTGFNPHKCFKALLRM